jgi:hypothetical protein
VARAVSAGDARDADLATSLAAGGVFVPGCTHGYDTDCELVVRSTDGAIEIVVAARVVWVDGSKGAGLQLIDVDDETKTRLGALAGASPAEGEAAASDDTDETGDVLRTAPPTLQERLRGLTLVQQIKLAHTGEVQERILLERMYGKHVWDALLHNPRLTGPEVARIARMGTLPRTQLELILNNGGWLQIPEVRRALLANPRLGTDQILRVLRLVPKPELKLAATQTAYPFAVRDAAKRLLRES